MGSFWSVMLCHFFFLYLARGPARKFSKGPTQSGAFPKTWETPRFGKPWGLLNGVQVTRGIVNFFVGLALYNAPSLHAVDLLHVCSEGFSKTNVCRVKNAMKLGICSSKERTYTHICCCCCFLSSYYCCCCCCCCCCYCCCCCCWWWPPFDGRTRRKEEQSTSLATWIGATSKSQIASDCNRSSKDWLWHQRSPRKPTLRTRDYVACIVFQRYSIRLKAP